MDISRNIDCSGLSVSELRNYIQKLVSENIDKGVVSINMQNASKDLSRSATCMYSSTLSLSLFPIRDDNNEILGYTAKFSKRV